MIKNETQTMIELKNVSKRFGNHQVLKAINLTVKPGEIIGLIGENGAGKSTIINLLLGLLQASSGEVSVLGEAPAQESHKQKLGAMLQENVSMESIKVRELLTLVRSYYAKPLPYQDLLELADLTSVQAMISDKLSGGQKRRLTFALAMAGDPDLLFLDEPTVGMDVNSRQHFWSKIEQMRAQGKTIVVTNHYLDELEGIVSRLLILQHGVFSFDGTLAELQQQYAKRTITFESTLPLVKVYEYLPDANLKEKNHQFSLKTSDSDQALRQLAPILTQLSNITIQPDSLNAIFGNLTKQTVSHTQGDVQDD
ncbi:ABC transporter ATP-binding protein [Lactobacillus sp. CC-MHH1034]|uniref:ABC transporter ATP-binding protein n=1 Tax=Agrilactobacillus fermenti TaxID=2586909 RepID=UPI001E5F5F09|nr:ABC transporter ATP-binding protein [Agrilactobacillus fermenti]MCD2256172.1 ABC transporter ATP-binding protein [Agrilactobacillus fermenti]